MNPFTLLDSWLLDKVQNIVNALHKYFGLGKAILAKLRLVTGFIFCVLYLYFQHFLVDASDTAFWALANVFVFLFLWRQISKVENENSDTVLSVGMLSLGFARAFFLAFTILALINILPRAIWGADNMDVLKQQRLRLSDISFIAREFLYTTSLYLASCKTPPKKKSWIEEKAEQFREWLRPAPQVPQLTIV